MGVQNVCYHEEDLGWEVEQWTWPHLSDGHIEFDESMTTLNSLLRYFTSFSLSGNVKDRCRRVEVLSDVPCILIMFGLFVKIFCPIDTLWDGLYEFDTEAIIV